MALSPETNEAFVREVDEELRKDEAIALWQRWGRAIIAAVVVGLAAFAGWLWWQSHQLDRAGQQGESYGDAIDALGKQDVATAEPKLAELAKDGTEGYSALAKFTQADLALQKQDVKGAAALFAEVAQDGGIAQPLRDLALVRQTSAEFDTLAPQAVIDRLRPLAAKGEPWFGSAGEMSAIAELRLGRRDLAARRFAEIAADQNVPATIRQRAVQMAGVLGVDAVKQTEGKKAQ